MKLLAWLKSLFTHKEATNVADEAVIPEATVVAPVVAPVVAETPTIDLNALKNIIKALGHDVELVWADAVALAKKKV